MNSGVNQTRRIEFGITESSATLGTIFRFIFFQKKSAYHDAGIPHRYHGRKMPNPAKIRPFCANGRARRIRAQSVAYCSQRCQLEHYHQRMVALWQSGALPPRLTSTVRYDATSSTQPAKNASAAVGMNAIPLRDGCRSRSSTSTEIGRTMLPTTSACYALTAMR